MSKQQHTPGPWVFYDDSNDGKTNRIEIVALGKTVARIYHSVPAEDLPNARLIAAAPELLEALLLFVSCQHPVSTEIDDRGHRWSEAYLDQALPIAMSAITKAKGA